MPYSPKGVTGQTLGWFDPADLEGIDDNFPGMVYADVHNVPILNPEQVQAGNWHDSYYARVVGITRNEPDWMCKQDILLTTVFEEVAARTEYKADWEGHLKDKLKTMRMRYQVNDRPQHQCGKVLLTNRELDTITEDLRCSDCEVPASMVPRSDISLDDEGKTFQCTECVIKEIEKTEKASVTPIKKEMKA